MILRKISFEVQAGEKVGIVGRTGAGKSTLSMALTRIVELASGAIEIDDLDISKLDITHLRDQITMIPQDPIIFAGSLRYNVDPFNENTDDRIKELIGKAGLEYLIEGGKGLEFVVQEEGKNLSLGERQLICIIRAILRCNKIVILDEATANIDVVTETVI